MLHERRRAPTAASGSARLAVVVVVTLLTGWIVFLLVARAGLSTALAGDEGPQVGSPARDEPAAQKPAARSTTRPVGVGSASGSQLYAKPPLGGIHQDQGSTVKLPDGRTLWIFADTFQLYNQPKFFNTSSAALTNPGAWRLAYSRDSRGVPVEFMPRTAAESSDKRSGDFYQAVWPTGSTQLPDGRIIISYAKYKVLLKTKQFTFLGGGLFEYRYKNAQSLLRGGQARRIANDIWTPSDGEVRSPVYVDGYVYFHHCSQLRCYALRTTPGKLTDRSSYRWWTGGDVWVKDRS